MDIHEHIQLVEGQIAKGEEYISNAIKNRKFNLAVACVDSHFMNLMEMGIIQWRLGQNPVSWLKQALDCMLRRREELLGLGVSPGSLKELPLFHSIYVASLLNASHPALELLEYDGFALPAAFLGNVLLGTDSIENWPQHQSNLLKQKGRALPKATLELYAGLLSGQMGNAQGVEKGEAYFRRRENDPFYQDSAALHGGSYLNDRFVDFRLGAILKHIGSTVPSIHAWRW